MRARLGLADTHPRAVDAKVGYSTQPKPTLPESAAHRVVETLSILLRGGRHDKETIHRPVMILAEREPVRGSVIPADFEGDDVSAVYEGQVGFGSLMRSPHTAH